MKGLILLAILAIIGIVLPYLYLVKIENSMIDNLGKNVIIKNDTFLIVGYSIFNQEYVLSDGKNYNVVFVNKNIINK